MICDPFLDQISAEIGSEQSFVKESRTANRTNFLYFQSRSTMAQPQPYKKPRQNIKKSRVWIINPSSSCINNKSSTPFRFLVPFKNPPVFTEVYLVNSPSLFSSLCGRRPCPQSSHRKVRWVYKVGMQRQRITTDFYIKHYLQ